MHLSFTFCVRRIRWAALLGAVALAPVAALRAQVPQQLPSPDQAREMLRTQPQLVEQLRRRVMESGMTPDQVRARLRAAGYPESMLNEFLPGADTTLAVRPGPQALGAARALGILSSEEAESLQTQDSISAL